MPLLRENAPIATGQQRRAMCQLALADLPTEVANKVQVNPIEILRTGPSYAIDTVEAVAQNYPDDTIVLVIGKMPQISWSNGIALMNYAPWWNF